MLWTPRGTHIKSNRSGAKTTLFTPSAKTRFTFKPVATEYRSPPPVKPVKAAPSSAKKSYTSASDLKSQADELEAEASSLDKLALAASTSPPLSMQLGLLVQCKEDFIKKCLSSWDTKGRGEFAKNEFRINLRKVGLDPSAIDADALVCAPQTPALAMGSHTCVPTRPLSSSPLCAQFDSWDRDGGGALDLAELRSALQRVGEKARLWRTRGDPNAKKAGQLRARAKHFKEAGEATEAAERLEKELEALHQVHSSSAEIRLGEFLAKRCIKPGAVVTQWSNSRGQHAGELSKKEFRIAVQNLGLANSGVSEQDIDGVFDKFDAVSVPGRGAACSSRT